MDNMETSPILTAMNYSARAQAIETDFCTLDEVFSIIRSNDWVYDFFINSSDDEVDMLMYACSIEACATVQFHIESYASNDPVADPFCQKELRSLLFLPSFSTGFITVGFIVTKNVSSTNNVAARERFVGRFAYSSSKNQLLMINDNPLLNVCEVQFLNLETKSQRKTFVAMFDLMKLQKAISTSNNVGGFDRDAFIDALLFDYQSSEFRICPSCGGYPCSCVVQLRKRRFALDVDVDIQNLSAFCGGYDGFSRMRLFSLSTPVLSVSFKSISNCVPTIDFGVKKNLTDWVLHDSISRKTSKSLVPRGIAVVYSTDDVEAEKNSDLLDREIKTAIDRFMQACVISIRSTPSNNPTKASGCVNNNVNIFAAADVNQSETGPCHMDTEDLSHNLDIGILTNQPMSDDLEDVIFREESNSIHDMEFDETPLLDSNLVTALQSIGEIMPATENANIETNISNVPVTNLETVEQIGSNSSTDLTNSSSHGSQNITTSINGINDQEMLQLQPKAIKILPRQDLEQKDDPDSRARNAAEEIVEKNAAERKKREELRKLRNRLSAARSNARRQKATKQLEHDFVQITAKKDELEKRRNDLMKKNELLRQQLNTDTVEQE